MKYVLYIFCVMLLIACNDFTEDDKNDLLKVDTEQEMINFVNGLYGLLEQVHNENYFYLFFRSDDVKSYTNSSFNNCELSNEITYLNEVADNAYLNLYRVVININYLLDNASENFESDYFGELYFLRAYCYFKLVRLYDDPPIVSDCEVDFQLPRSTRKEVYDFIEEDLLAALDLLPENNLKARVYMETPTKVTAKAYLAELYLTMGGYPLNNTSYYSKAAEIGEDLINNKSAYNIDLLDDFSMLWKDIDHHNVENLFALFNSRKTNDIGANQIVRGNLDYFAVQGKYSPSFSFFDKYPLSYRKINTLVYGQYNVQDYFTMDEIFIDLYFQNWFSPGGYRNHMPIFKLFNPEKDPCEYANGAHYLKWIKSEQIGLNEYGDVKYAERQFSTLYLMRYAQVLLTYAEAKARSGQLDEKAFEAVNEVRRRAQKVDPDQASIYDLQPGITAEQFVDSVVWERALEICFEPDGRWFDIVRLNMKEQLDAERNTNDPVLEFDRNLLSDDWYFYKIPQHDRWINSQYSTLIIEPNEDF